MFKTITRKIVYRAIPHLKDAHARLGAIENAFSILATSPEYLSDENSFNGQRVRRSLVTEVLQNMKPSCIIETGTFVGETTGFFAKFGIPVISSEISAPLFYAAKQRLAKFKNVKLMLCDSRVLFRNIISDNFNNKPAFIYLDAHWLDDLPLLEEIRLIDANWDKYIILIDDFQVPSDSGYGYDKYSNKRILNLSYISEYLANKPIMVFFPSGPSSRETGAKRGYVFLAKGTENTKLLEGLEKLTPYSLRTL
jgi:hypothetical protein